MKYLDQGQLPDVSQNARKLKMRAVRFVVIDGELYKRGFSMPYLRCLARKEIDYVLREIHEGICGNHLGARAQPLKLSVKNSFG